MHLPILLMSMIIPGLAFSQHIPLVVGTYSQNGSKGIYTYRFNVGSGQFVPLSSTDSAANPSFVALSRNGNFLYAVNETHGDVPGKISAYRFNKATGRMVLINQQLTHGDDPCYVSIDKTNRWVLVANYSGGSLAAFRVRGDGGLHPAAQVIAHSGTGPNKQRQEKPHVHATVFSPDQKFLFATDLGTDKVMIYQFNPAASVPLKPAAQSFVAAEPGSGPRHLTFHPNGRFAYLMEEMAGFVSVYKYNNGRLTPLQRVAAHPAGYKGNIGSADIHLSPDGRFLYCSNRGDENNIAIFAVNNSNGSLQLRGYQSTLGQTPRNFCIDPTGKYLLAANQNSDNIVVFRRNQATGGLTATGRQLQVPRPVCLVMLK